MRKLAARLTRTQIAGALRAPAATRLSGEPATQAIQCLSLIYALWETAENSNLFTAISFALIRDKIGENAVASRNAEIARKERERVGGKKPLMDDDCGKRAKENAQQGNL